MVFEHSWKDGILVALTFVAYGLLVSAALLFQNVAWPWMVALGGMLVFLNSTNYQCIAHNFLHNPFFRHNIANNVFSVLNSVVLGMPQTLYKYHHLNHHQFNNDYQDPETHETRDHSSTYRFSREPRREESLMAYALFGPFRMKLSYLYAKASGKGRGFLVWCEAAALLSAVAALIWFSPLFVLMFVFPVWYLGQASALAENYLEHHLATPGNRQTDSVSCYSRFYNWIWFNNGYHQEHHYRPNVHWTRITAVRDEMLPEADRRVVRGAHWLNF